MRLLKVQVQAVYVDEVDEEMVEVVAPPVGFTAAQWRALDPAAFAAELIDHLTEQSNKENPQ